jgi:hypothetical protein
MAQLKMTHLDPLHLLQAACHLHNLSRPYTRGMPGFDKLDEQLQALYSYMADKKASFKTGNTVTELQPYIVLAYHVLARARRDSVTLLAPEMRQLIHGCYDETLRLQPQRLVAHDPVFIEALDPLPYQESPMQVTLKRRDAKITRKQGATPWRFYPTPDWVPAGTACQVFVTSGDLCLTSIGILSASVLRIETGGGDGNKSANKKKLSAVIAAPPIRAIGFGVRTVKSQKLVKKTMVYSVSATALVESPRKKAPVVVSETL